MAGITALQRCGLRERAVGTRTALAGLPLPIPWPMEGTSSESLTRVREQARLQVAGDRAGSVLYELFDPKKTLEGALAQNVGLLSLPEPSPGDLFLDIEGDPFALEDGVDYLFGVIEPGPLDTKGSPTYHNFWSRDAKGAVSLVGEKQAFERVMDLLMDRLAQDPNLHIYHYAAYEPTAMGRLMGRHATREEEVDRLLRGAVLVDLYRAVRQGVRASVESYSIKKLEPLYGFERTVDLRDAGASMVAFSVWLDTAGAEEGDPAILERIEGYNRDDCVSNWKLRDWLEDRRQELAERIGGPLPRPAPAEGKASDKLSERLQHVKAVEEKLTGDVSQDPAERTEEQQARWLLAQLLSWHRREEKSTWWRYYHLLKLTDEERLEQPEPLSGLVHIADLGRIGRSKNPVHRYRFPPQEHEVTADWPAIDPVTGRSSGTILCIDEIAGTIDIRITKNAPNPTSLVPKLFISAEAQQNSLLRTGKWVTDNGIEGPGLGQAGRELLLRRPPRLGQAAGASLSSGQPAVEAARRLGTTLDGSCLAIQGPPGSGKTTAGGEMIVDLVLAGKKVGVTANSHKVIGNLLDEVAVAARKRRVTVRIAQKPADDEDCTCPVATRFTDNQKLRDDIAAGVVDVVGGTTWVWSRKEFGDLLDVLFIDEAGQMSLANAVAVAPAAKSLVLLGDPQQLNQPLKGSHPPGADHSALGHLLAGNATMPPHLGLFLERTWRLHPDICDYTSEVFYEGRLSAEPGRERQQVVGTAPLNGSGIRFIPVHHVGNSNDSLEEAAVVAQLVGQLLAGEGQWVSDRAEVSPLRLEDVLVITPYNAQVRTIASTLAGIRVGTVDKFQGQQAPIAIYSMATSSAEQAPRGMEFLYNLYRLNVATSRARCISVVVASPELIRVRCRTARQMKLANALCRFIEMAQAA